jgi:hypothetical protein
MRSDAARSTRSSHRPFPRRAVLPILFVIGLMSVATQSGTAQGTFRLKRSKSQSFPLTIQLYGGYNSMNHPAEKLQKDFETVNNSWGGVMLGLKARMRLDTILRPVWFGIDMYYHGTAKRYLPAKYSDSSVYYASDHSPVNAWEYLYTLGGNLFFAIDVYKRIFIEFGGGMQYMISKADVTSDVVGLYKPVWIPVLMAGITVPLLRYEHGSIDAHIRFTKGSGEYGSLHFQSLLQFTFNF